MLKKCGLSLIVSVLAYYPSVFAQAPEERIVQPIIIDGQQAQGVFVVRNGTIQSQTCPYPRQYFTADQSSSGWACFEQSTGMWLLQALPPKTAGPQQGPTIVYSQPSTVYVPAPAYGYGYGYYPYSYYGSPYYGYPYVFGPSFGFGFGFGFGSPIIANRAFIGRPFIGRPFVSRPFIGGGFVGRPVLPSSRPFGGFGRVGAGRMGVGRAFGGVGRR